MNVTTLFSGSSGNCIYLKEKNTEILVDAGGSMRQLEESLKGVDSSLSQISAIFITHEHSDHTKGLPVMCKHLTVPIYCQKEVAKELYLGLLSKGKKCEAAALAKCIRTVEPSYEYEVGDLTFTPFSTPHDSVDSQGFVVGERELGIATDLGHVSEEVRRYLLGCKSVILESNHDPDMLWDGPYPPYLKERVASDHGHLNNQDCAAFAKELLSAGCENLTLFHLSKDNNTPDLALSVTEKALRECGASVGEDILLRAAHRFEGTKVL